MVQPSIWPSNRQMGGEGGLGGKGWCGGSDAAARTDGHQVDIYGKAEIRFVRGRLRFGGAANPAPFPSMVVVFRGEGKYGEA